jgi:PEGA domain
MHLNGLPVDLAKFVDDALASGHYPSVEALVCDALQILREHDAPPSVLPSEDERPPDAPPQSPDDYRRAVVQALRTGEFGRARQLATEGAARYPEHGELAKSAIVARETLADFGTKSPRSYLQWGGVAAAGLLLVAGLWWGWQSHWLNNAERSALESFHLTQLIPDVFRSSKAGWPLEGPALPTQERFVGSAPQSVLEPEFPSAASPIPILPPPQVSESVGPQGSVTVEPQGRRSSHPPKQEVPEASVGQRPKPRLVVLHRDTSVGQNRGSVEMVAPVGQSSADTRRREAARQATKAPPGLHKPGSTPPDAFMSESQSSPPSAMPREYVGATPDREITPAGTDRAASPPSRQIVHFHSFPDAATVLIDGKSIGRTPVAVALPMGSYSILVEKSGETSIRYQWNIDRDGERHLYHHLQADVQRR